MGFLDKVLGDLMRDHSGRRARRLLRQVGAKKLLLAGGVLAGDALLNPATGAPRGSGYGFTKGEDARTSTPPPAVPPAGLPPVPGVAAGPGLPRGTAQPLSGGAGESPAGRTPAAAPGSVPPPGAVPPPLDAAAEPGQDFDAAPAPPPPPPPDADPTVAEEGRGADAPGPEADEDEVTLPPGLTFAAVRTMIAAALSDGHLGSEERSAVERRLEEADLSPQEVARIHKDLVLPASVRELAELAPAAVERELLYQLAAAVVAADGQMLAPESDWLRGLALAFEIDEGRARDLEGDVLAQLRDDDPAPG